MLLIWRLLLEQEKKAALYIGLAIFLIGVSGCIIYKFWDARKSIEEAKKQTTELEKQIDIIEDNSENFVVSSLEDKRRGIRFFDNPLRASNYIDNVTKMQEINKKIYRLKKQKKVGEEDIMNLKERNDWYKNEIKDLQDEFERKKKEAFDVGHAHGYSESLFREYD